MRRWKQDGLRKEGSLGLLGIVRMCGMGGVR